MYQLTLRDVTYQGYPIQYPLTGSSSAENTEISEILDNSFFFLMKQEWLKDPLSNKSLFPGLEIDLSSVFPHFEIKSETSLTRETVEETSLGEMLEYDVVVRIPPKRRYSVQMEIKSIRRGTPRIVEPEGLL